MRHTRHCSVRWISLAQLLFLTGNCFPAGFQYPSWIKDTHGRKKIICQIPTSICKSIYLGNVIRVSKSTNEMASTVCLGLALYTYRQLVVTWQMANLQFGGGSFSSIKFSGRQHNFPNLSLNLLSQLNCTQFYSLHTEENRTSLCTPLRLLITPNWCAQERTCQFTSDVLHPQCWSWIEEKPNSLVFSYSQLLGNRVTSQRASSRRNEISK